MARIWEIEAVQRAERSPARTCRHVRGLLIEGQRWTVSQVVAAAKLGDRFMIPGPKGSAGAWIEVGECACGMPSLMVRVRTPELHRLRRVVPPAIPRADFEAFRGVLGIAVHQCKLSDLGAKSLVERNKS